MTGNFVRCELLERIVFENGSCDFSLLLTRSWQSQQILIDRNLQMQQLCSAIKTNKEKERSEDTDEHTYTNVHTCTHTHTHMQSCGEREKGRAKNDRLKGVDKKTEKLLCPLSAQTIPFLFLSKQVVSP
jgi:hypothetical protein